ncbi:MAG: hypothetical protein HGB15_01505 [Chlorobaculum sp.]|nr:hypothetical protein [Chlorobaculum sp.]
MDHLLIAGASGGMANRDGKIPPKHQLFTANEYRKNMLIPCDIIVNPSEKPFFRLAATRSAASNWLRVTEEPLAFCASQQGIRKGRT